VVLTALIPVLLAGAPPSAGTARPESIAGAVAGVDQAIAGPSPATQGVFAEWSDLHRFSPSPMIVAGVRLPSAEASAEAAGRFFATWRNSRSLVLESRYGALHDLMHGAWHVQPQTLTAIDYPGRREVE
jgi:hypothetical protein